MIGKIVKMDKRNITIRPKIPFIRLLTSFRPNFMLRSINGDKRDKRFCWVQEIEHWVHTEANQPTR